MGKKKAPAPPAPAQSIQQQQGANRVNVFSRQGNQIYGTTQNGQFIPGNNQSSMVIEQTPFQQEYSNVAETAGLQLAHLLGGNAYGLQSVNLNGLPKLTNGLDFSKISALPTMDQFGDQAKQAQDAFYQ